jgi:hypothetical protein
MKILTLGLFLLFGAIAFARPISTCWTCVTTFRSNIEGEFYTQIKTALPGSSRASAMEQALSFCQASASRVIEGGYGCQIKKVYREACLGRPGPIDGDGPHGGCADGSSYGMCNDRTTCCRGGGCSDGSACF